MGGGDKERKVESTGQMKSRGAHGGERKKRIKKRKKERTQKK